MSYALELSGVSKTYENGFQALKGLDLKLEAGAFMALLGPNGAGKSTTIGILASLVNPTEGSVKIFGHDLASNPTAAKRLLGVVPQEFNFNMFEPCEEILYQQAGFYGISRRRARPRIEQLLRQLDLWEKRKGPARQLSGGMKRRLMIARALIHNPRVLLLDEPSAGVDIELRRSMWKFVEELNREQGVTIILTTHYLEEAEQLCRHLAIIDRGELIEQGPIEELLRQRNQEHFVLDCAQPLSRAPEIPGYPLRLRGASTLELALARGQELNGLFTELAQRGIAVFSLRNAKNRLEALFEERLAQRKQSAAQAEEQKQEASNDSADSNNASLEAVA